jgi:hypothetical protein
MRSSSGQGREHSTSLKLRNQSFPASRRTVIVFGRLRIDGETGIGSKEGSIPRPMWRIGVVNVRSLCRGGSDSFLNPQNPGDVGQPTTA